MSERSSIMRLRLAGVALLAITAGPAVAHHSFNAYDVSKTESVSGAIKEFRWGAPHSSLVLTYTDKAGKPQIMSVISGSPLMFSRQGFAPRDFHRGEQVTITFHPNTSGAPGGALASLTMANGKVYRDAEVASAAGPGGPPPPPGPPGK
jgi:Family of unknown function (DUF6152)